MVLLPGVVAETRQRIHVIHHDGIRLQRRRRHLERRGVGGRPRPPREATHGRHARKAGQRKGTWVRRMFLRRLEEKEEEREGTEEGAAVEAAIVVMTCVG